jgi:hypothetical protein
MKKLGLICELYRDSYNCPLNKFDNVKKVIVPIEGGVFDPNEETPAVTIVRRNLSHGEYIHAEPADKLPGEWFAFGGSFIYTSDSRYSEQINKYPIPLHDRRMNLE